MDDDYNYSMWVELYNSGTTTLNQSGYYFTDDLDEPQKWSPQSKSIAPGGFSVLWFERSDRDGHASFKLDPEGGKLYLLSASAQVVDSVIYPKQYHNVSYGRKTDGGDEWVYFEGYTKGTSNNGNKWSRERCAAPVLKLTPGFYTGMKNEAFESPETSDTIYYSLNGTEPTRKNTKYTPGFVITLSSTTILRARTFSGTKVPSEIVTGTYFFNQRDFHLPVVSIVTEQANLTDNTIGIYVQGTNGMPGNGTTEACNWNQYWDRPANFELFDTTLVQQVNQEVNISIAGGWTRTMNAQKSLKVDPSKKFGNNKITYDIFKATKPDRKYKSILYRNAGNDFGYSMLRDGFMQSIVWKRMNLDQPAYEPAVCFMNGVYYGIQNLRERTNEDFLYSNYGLDSDDVYLLETTELTTDTAFTNLTNYISNNDITQQSVYDYVCSQIDIDNLIDYYITEIYYGNTDWPDNNVKVWKKKESGSKWRWILYDLDFGYSLYDTNLFNHNTLTYALGELSSDIPPAWSTLMLSRLVKNDTFLQQFIDRFAIQISSTFLPARAETILDSLAAKISTEITYHKAKWGSSRNFDTDLTNMKTFAASRPDKMLGFISSRFLNSVSTQILSLSANNDKATYTFNGEQIIDSVIDLKYFSGKNFSVKANDIPGYKFSCWEIAGASSALTLIADGSSWKYYDGSSIPASNWYAADYSDAAWSSGTAQFGYGNKGEVTTISYGNDANNKYPTAYFRKTVNISSLSSKSDFEISAYFDDGIVVYVNGVEVGRNNITSGTVNFSTYASVYNNGITATFSVPEELLVEGENVIAAEVHQINATSSDLIFDLKMTYTQPTGVEQSADATYSGALSGTAMLRAVYEQTIFEDPDKDIEVLINEVVSSNNQIEDELGNKGDYIEIYNNSGKDVNIAGWYITDTPSNVTLAQIPATDSAKTLIPSKDRIVLWADDKPENGVLHLGFKLSKDGEKLVLSRSNYLGTIVLADSVTVPYLEQNTSYSRVPDASENWMVTTPTYDAANQAPAGTDNLIYGVRLYPTMVNNNFIVENASGSTLRMYNLAGKLLIECPIENARFVVQSGSLPKGIYLVNIGAERFKIIKL